MTILCLVYNPCDMLYWWAMEARILTNATRAIETSITKCKEFYMCPFLCCEVIRLYLKSRAARVIVGVIIIVGVLSMCFCYINEDDCAEGTDGLTGGSFHNVKAMQPQSQCLEQCDASVCVCVSDGGVWERIIFMKVSVMMEQPDKFAMFLFLGCLLCAPNTLHHLSHLISIGFNPHVSHVVASQLKNKLWQYGSIRSCSKYYFLYFNTFSCRLLCFLHFHAATVVFFPGCHCIHP